MKSKELPNLRGAFRVRVKTGLSVCIGICAAACLSGCVSACAPGAIGQMGTPEALFPPVFERLETGDSRTITLSFDKEAALLEPPEVSPALPVSSAASDGSDIIVTFDEDQEAGTEYLLSGTVADAEGNRMRLIVPFYGYNPNPPSVLLNEFTTQGSSAKPDCVELAVIRGGNTAGLCVYQGTRNSFTDRKILPPIAVAAGDFVIIHWKPQAVSDEKDETTDKGESGGLMSSGDAWDLWVQGGTGLSGNNGVLTLYSSPTGHLLDGVLYSNRTSGSDTNYAGFGSQSVYERALELAEEEGWAVSGDSIAPEDGINPDDSTATRSMCRASASADTNSAADWHIVPTGKASFGAVNSDEVYTP